jgi:hypothetical protein
MGDVAESAPAPAAPEAAPSPDGETATVPSVAGGAELGAGITGRAAAIAKARDAMNAHQAEARETAVKQAIEHAEKTRAKAERDAAPERDESGRFKPADPKPAAPKEEPPPEKPKAPDDDKSELERLEEQWRKVRSAKRGARDERRAAAAWREEQARAKAEEEADRKLKEASPAGWLEKHGFDFREEAKRAVSKADETPAEKRAKEAEERARIAQEKADALERRINEREQQTARSNALAELNATHRSAWGDTKSDYPTLAEHYSEQEIMDTCLELRVEYFKNTGREIPPSAAFSHMEKMARQHRERFTRKPNGNGKPASTERATVAGKPAKTRAVSGPITNREAATKTAPPAGLSPEEKRARATEIAAKGWRQ